MTDIDTRVAGDGRTNEHAKRERGVWIAVLYAVTTFVGASLLFMVQPLAAKLILPSFGGSATVWSTSSLFFQVLLLLGYLYAHVATRRLGARWQPRAHLLVVLLPIVAIPIALPAGAAPDADASPTLWLLRVLTVMVGLPFLVLSATGPLIQRWYSWSGGPRADDPYFLFAGSNLGSFIGLLSYPFVIEPTLTLSQQRWGWSGGLVGFLVLMGCCALTVSRPTAADAAGAAATLSRATRPSGRQILAWGSLAFLPSCLMLAVTAHISTDVAPIPLVWVLPLAVYLATFVIAFARSSRSAPVTVTRLAVTSAFLAGVVSLIAPQLPIVVVVTLDVALVALLGYAAHARLASTRPSTEQLTAFYLIISSGGALGGLVNGVIAPIMFNRVWEYGLSLAAAPLLLVGLVSAPSNWLTRRYHPAFRLIVGAALTPTVMLAGAAIILWAADINVLGALAAIALVGVAGWLAARAPVVLAVSLLVGTAAVGAQAMAGSMLTDRTFYGSYRVTDEKGQHKLVHGTTVHGVQGWAKEDRDIPTAYYAAEGPLGDVMANVGRTRTGIVGLGAGGIAAYARAGEHFSFYEIDPVIAEIANDPEYFTFLADSAGEVDVVVGDGRLRLQEEPLAEFDLLVLDAFSSDSIPVHLLTREALSAYFDRLRPDGALVVHVSNRIFDLEPVLAAASADLGAPGVIGEGGRTDKPDSTESRWIVLSRNFRLLDALRAADWTSLRADGTRTWSDDYASILSALR